MSNYISSELNLNERFLFLTKKLNKSLKVTDKKLKSQDGRYQIIEADLTEEMPIWALKHLECHKQMRDLINASNERGQSEQIPRKALKFFAKSKEMVRKISKVVNYKAYLSAIQLSKSISYADDAKLLTGKNLKSSTHLRPSQYEWGLNFGLLNSIFSRAENKKTQKLLRFLMANYLAKAAYLNTYPRCDELSDGDQKKYMNMLQYGMLSLAKTGMYHRTAATLDLRILRNFLNMEDKLGSKMEKVTDSFFPTDTTHFEKLYCLCFVKAPDLSEEDTIIDILINQFEKYHENFPLEDMKFPTLIDITPEIGQTIITDGDKKKILKYIDRQQFAKVKINAIISEAVNIIFERYPDHEEIRNKIEDYLKINTAIVSRAKVNSSVSILAVHSYMFDDSDFNEDEIQRLKCLIDTKLPYETRPLSRRRQFIMEKVQDWVGLCGIAMGGVSLRNAIASVMENPSTVHHCKYEIPGNTDVIVFSNPTDLISTNAFASLTDPKLGEGQKLLGKATAKMIKVLLKNISPKKWSAANEDRALRELLQTALLRTQLHLQDADNRCHDFKKYSQAIERVHAELTTILVIFKPFSKKAFLRRYDKFLVENFPRGISPTEIGIGRSAMNIFSGINAAILSENSNPVRVCDEHSYYEEAMLVGETHTFEDVINNPEIDHIDLYLAEFYHNIDCDLGHTHYEKGQVIENVRRIFETKPHTKKLTVAIDGTIDFAQSENIRNLTEEFKDLIDDGKLNIIVFRSGQKFDMLGLDNYYGGLFYIVNNGDEKWSIFNNLKEDEVFRTDELSEQFFCWTAKTGPEIVDSYKEQIFNNTREILNLVPEELKPTDEKDVCVCTFDEDVKTPFIDIKIGIPDLWKQDELQVWAVKKFIEIFVENNKLVYRRGSFGFAHPNLTWIIPKLRINPGIDPDEIRLYRQFFDELLQELNLRL